MLRNKIHNVELCLSHKKFIWFSFSKRIKSSYVLNYSFVIKYDIFFLLTFKQNVHTIGTKFDMHI